MTATQRRRKDKLAGARSNFTFPHNGTDSFLTVGFLSSSRLTVSSCRPSLRIVSSEVGYISQGTAGGSPDFPMQRGELLQAKRRRDTMLHSLHVVRFIVFSWKENEEMVVVVVGGAGAD